MKKVYAAFWLGTVGASWAYETFSIVTGRTPTITTLIHSHRHIPIVPRATVAGCIGIAAVAIKHLVIVKEIIEAEVASAA